jgi:hypothetical protein
MNFFGRATMPFALMPVLAGCVSQQAYKQQRQKYDGLRTRANRYPNAAVAPPQ